MHKRTILTAYASIFLLLAMLGALSIAPIRAAKTWTVDDDGPADFSIIQDAINAASPGDTIEVASGIYYENVVVGKSLTIEGNGSGTTIIDGNGTETIVRINAPDVNITGFTLQNGGDLPYSGISLGGKCVRNTICYNVIRKNAIGIKLQESNGCIIFGNKIANNSGEGIHVAKSNNNVIHYNMIANNSWGVWITSEFSLFNTFYHNTFIDNPNHAKDHALTTKWDNGAEGNYWSDYNGLVDLDGDGIGDGDLDGDGIGESLLPYRVPDFGEDNFPLMEPWSPYRVFDYNVTTFSNSTLASFNFSQPLKQISFNATSGASGFCNVTIPKTLLNVSTLDEWKVIIDGIPVNRTIKENATHTSLYFTYSKGVHQIVITTREVILSTISMNFSSTTITLGDSVTISGNITVAGDPINPLRPNVNVTIQLWNTTFKTWDTFATVTTNQNSQYSYTWTQNKTGTYEFKAAWKGDLETLGDESDVKTLRVLGTPVRRQPFEVTVEGEVFEVVIKSNFTVSSFVFNESLNEIYFNVDGMAGNTYVCNVIIPKGLLWCDNVIDWVVWIDNVKASVEIDKNETHTILYFTYLASVHNVRIATKISTISMALSEDSITLGDSVTISGTIIPLRTNVNVTIQSRLSGDADWTTLDIVETDLNGVYSYTWTPEKAGTYEIKASWPGDLETLGDETSIQTLEVEGAASIPLEIVIAAVVAIIIIVVIVVYFVKIRKK